MTTLTQSKAERKVITELLELYKAHPCLWKSNHFQYGNSSDARKRAYSLLLETFKKLDKDATLESLKKKIDNLRASYRRESRKVMRNKHHRPSLWYYNLLTFLDEGTTIVEPKSENDDVSYFASTADETFHAEFEPMADEMDPNVNTGPYQPDESSYTIKPIDVSETGAFGRTIGLQLGELTPMQKTIAEKLISDVVYFARLDKLTTKTSLNNLNDDYL